LRSEDHEQRHRLPVFPGGAAYRESRRRRATTRTVALLTLALTGVYLIWRAAFTLNPSAWWLSLPLLLLEVHAALSLALYAFSLWDLDARPAPPLRRHPGRVAVLIPTYNEPEEILTPTIAAAVLLQPVHETWVLDDGDRPAVARLADELGARYLSRRDRAHAKAGNLNNALAVIDADLIAVFDADHVADPRFLTSTLGYFADPRVALVQTPQDFYNLSSFEHSRTAVDDGLSEQSLFYRVIQAGKNRWGAAFWCGTNAVLRVAALRAVGGVATGSVTEDIHTTIRLHRAGWRTVYHNEVLARGLAAGSAATYLSQRRRWGTGAMQVLRSRDNPLVARGLRRGQRLAYAFTLLGWFDAWRSLGYLLLPAVVLLTGASPISAPIVVFMPAFAGVLAVQQLALWLLGRGYQRPWLAVLFELVRLPANLAATLTLVGRRRHSFQVTAKGRTGGAHRRSPVPAVLWLVLLVSLLAAGWFGATLVGRTPLRYGVPAVAYGAVAWLLFNVLFVGAAITRIRALRFGSERRASVRFAVSLPARLGGCRCVVEDLSLTGAKIRATTILPSKPTTLAIDALGHKLTLRCEVRGRVEDQAGGETVMLWFPPGQVSARSALTVLLFNAGIGLEAAPAEPLAGVEEPVGAGAVAGS
jgi:cellulose synthase/poly-beta-1,6-N-acetylglucosamine synthase-like glycosyltransferase